MHVGFLKHLICLKKVQLLVRDVFPIYSKASLVNKLSMNPLKRYRVSL